ncbi:MAG: Asp-tRNA(Asn)/Glu-tRNA(Gln) amidotransferase subunit GatC [Patescibacteria group bacterium]
MKTGIVQHIAQLAQIPLTPHEEKDLEKAFDETLKVIDTLQELDVKNVEPTHQLTGLVNIVREDQIDDVHTLTQEQALSNAKLTHNGFFVVDQLIEQ